MLSMASSALRRSVLSEVVSATDARVGLLPLGREAVRNVVEPVDRVGVEWIAILLNAVAHVALVLTVLRDAHPATSLDSVVPRGG
jgi:hypothetical protein